MVSEQTKRIVERAKALYESDLRAGLETEHRGRFVAIEPDSGDYFLGDSFDSAVRAARSAHPARISHTIRIGHRTAFSIGLMDR